MGRHPFCACGRIHFWVGDANGPENSQQVADWYSFSHVIHGFLLYAAVRAIASFTSPKKPLAIGMWLIIAVTVEAGWELLENSPFIIARYRKTMAESYDGDSILNSMSDICFAIVGFILASRLPAWLTVALAVVMEIFVAHMIRDNLVLNVIMLIHPFAGIRHWQMNHS